MKTGFQGMMAHWIEVKEGKWKMRAEVIGFKAVSGNHSGENLGRHAVDLLNRVGIMDKHGTKVLSQSSGSCYGTLSCITALHCDVG
jgi:hypothetical protein